MNQSPKKNKYIIKNQKFCSIPFLYIQLQFKHIHCLRQIISFTVTPSPLRMVVNLRWKRICSKGEEPRARGGILDAKFLYLGKRDPHGSQLPMFHWSAFTQEQFNLVLFRKYRLNNTRGLSQSQTLSRVKGSMNGVHVTAVEASSCYQCLLDVHLKLCCLARLAVLLAPASQIHYSIDHPAFRDLPWRWQRSRRLSRNKDGIG